MMSAADPICIEHVAGPYNDHARPRQSEQQRWRASVYMAPLMAYAGSCMRAFTTCRYARYCATSSAGVSYVW